MQALTRSLLSAIFVAATVAAGPLPSDYGLDFQYPYDVIINPQPYIVQGAPQDPGEDYYPDYPGLDGGPYDYEVVFNDELDLPDEDDEADVEDEEGDVDDDAGNVEDEEGDVEDEEASPGNSGEPSVVEKPGKSRQKRQSGDRLLDLTLDTPNSDGSRRSLYKPRVYFDAAGNYRNRKNYDLGYNGGVGALLYRSRNGRHSFGASVGTFGFQGRFNGYKVNQPPSRNVRYGVGYTYSFK